MRWGALRLRESFLLFIWGVPPGDALGMTFVESLRPTHKPSHTHIHTHRKTDRHQYACLPHLPFSFYIVLLAVCLLLCNTDHIYIAHICKQCTGCISGMHADITDKKNLSFFKICNLNIILKTFKNKHNLPHDLKIECFTL